MWLWVQTVFAIACSYAVALGLWPVLVHLPEKWIRGLSLVAMPLAPYAGLVIGPDPISYKARCARLLIAIFGSALGTISYLYWRRAKNRRFGNYARFLWIAMGNPQRLILGHSTAPLPQNTGLTNAMRAFAAVAVIVVAWLAAAVVWRTEVVRSNWWVNYLAFVAVLVVMTTALGQAAWALGRMTGYRGRPLVDQIWLSRTPREFWRRWNWLVHWMFYRYIYLPLGKRKRVVLATLAVFLVSGLGHELLIKVSTGRATGHQTAFFLVSCLGVIASPKLERLARLGVGGEILMRAATIAFMLAASILMYATFSYFIPQLRVPSWLIW
jgi:hypothetical protein